MVQLFKIKKNQKSSQNELGQGEGDSPRVVLENRPLTRGEVNDHLKDIIRLAREERLEWAVPLVESLRKSLAHDNMTGNVPPGTLTVNGWMRLLAEWERQIVMLKERQRHFTLRFFEDYLEQSTARSTPLEPILDQLLTLMEKVHLEKSREAA
ncbi:MAG: hypothetical protein HQL52_11110 [Magnetococcales bacterium]|nr:hypothetical protein [Magnetococcales bacterium]